MSSTIRLNEEDFWIFPDMTKFFNKANIVFAGFDRKSGPYTLVDNNKPKDSFLLVKYPNISLICI